MRKVIRSSIRRRTDSRIQNLGALVGVLDQLRILSESQAVLRVKDGPVVGRRLGLQIGRRQPVLRDQIGGGEKRDAFTTGALDGVIPRQAAVLARHAMNFRKVSRVPLEIRDRLGRGRIEHRDQFHGAMPLGKPECT